MKNYLVKLISTFFGVGFLPKAPGTFGSLVGVIIYYFLHRQEYIFYAALFLLIMAGFAVSAKAEAVFGKKDPGCVVIDEIVGMMIALILVPLTWINVIIVFILFRFMDVFKPYPIRKIEQMHGGSGIMLDDIVAGLYANIVFQIGFNIASYRLL